MTTDTLFRTGNAFHGRHGIKGREALHGNPRIAFKVDGHSVVYGRFESSGQVSEVLMEGEHATAARLVTLLLQRGVEIETVRRSVGAGAAFAARVGNPTRGRHDVAAPPGQTPLQNNDNPKSHDGGGVSNDTAGPPDHVLARVLDRLMVITNGGPRTAAYRWLKKVDRRQRVNRNRTTYGFKHWAEEDEGQYVSVEEFEAAAVTLGFRLERIPGGNCWINIAEPTKQQKLWKRPRQ
jgi:hypothetical protein